jgi:hypothetical protein
LRFPAADFYKQFPLPTGIYKSKAIAFSPNAFGSEKAFPAESLFDLDKAVAGFFK